MAAPELETLLAVQERDIGIDQLRHRRETLPERAELADIASQGAAVDAERRQVAAQRDAAAKRQDDLEAELAATEGRVVTIEKRMYSGEVGAARELQAMAQEVDSLKHRASQFEDQAIAVLEEREPLDAEVDRLTARLGELEAAAGDAQRRLTAAEEAIDEELRAELEARNQLAAGLPPSLVETYEGLRERLGGVGAARLNGVSCSGCHLTLPATEVDRLKRSDPGTLVFCDQCGRILVR